jgi:hypothetical protein
VTCDDTFLVLWCGEVASIQRILPDPAGNLSLKPLGEALMPRCECHGGWYGTINQGFFITADAFAGVTFMRILDAAAKPDAGLLTPVKPEK